MIKKIEPEFSNEDRSRVIRSSVSKIKQRRIKILYGYGITGYGLNNLSNTVLREMMDELIKRNKDDR